MMISGFVFLFMFLLVYGFVVWYLWFNDNYDMLNKLSFLMLVFPILFAGNIVSFGLGTFSIGIFFTLFYYIIGFILVNGDNAESYKKTLQSHWYLTLVAMLFCLPLVLALKFGLIVATVPGMNNLIDDILIDRFAIAGLNISSFYIGQLLYASSFQFYQRQENFWFEWFGRIPFFMVIQSFMYYLVFVSVTPGTFQLIDIASNTLFALIYRVEFLALLAIPFYWLYNKKKKENTANDISS